MIWRIVETAKYKINQNPVPKTLDQFFSELLISVRLSIPLQGIRIRGAMRFDYVESEVTRRVKQEFFLSRIIQKKRRQIWDAEGVIYDCLIFALRAKINPSGDFRFGIAESDRPANPYRM